MREGIYWRGNQRVPLLQEDDNDPIENVSLSSRIQGHRRASKLLFLCLILCILTWTTTKTSRPPLLISTNRSIHQATKQGIIFELFSYNTHLQAHNRTFTITNTMHQRRRSFVLNEDNLESPSRHLLKSIAHEICNDDNDEYEKQLFDGQGDEFNPCYQSLTKRMEVQNIPTKDSPIEEASLLQKSLGQWPLQGGLRETDLDIQAFYVKAPIGFDLESTEYFLHIDTGSGITWIMCKGRGPITAVGPNGLFKPKKKSFLDCRKEDLCSAFQEYDEFPCNEERHFKCEFFHEFGDGLKVRGHVVEGDVSFELNDGSQSNAQVAFGCADKVKDKNAQSPIQLTDGLIGLGPHRASWVHQLKTLGLISNEIVAICLNPDVEDRSQRQGPLLPTSVGFLSFGNSFESQVGTILWTNNIPVYDVDGKLEPIYTARLMKIHYRTKTIYLQEPISKKERRNSNPRVAIPGVRMGFDTGSDLTYLTTKIYHDVVQVLNKEAKSKGYQRTKDSNEFVKHEHRMCWLNRGQKIPVTEFGDLVFEFESLANDGIPPNMVIKPQYYITSRDSRNHPRTCFNMLEEVEFDYGNIGAELMKRHLFLFNSNLNQIGWRAVKSCKDLDTVDHDLDIVDYDLDTIDRAESGT